MRTEGIAAAANVANWGPVVEGGLSRPLSEQDATTTASAKSAALAMRMRIDSVCVRDGCGRRAFRPASAASKVGGNRRFRKDALRADTAALHHCRRLQLTAAIPRLTHSASCGSSATTSASTTTQVDID